MPGSFGCGGSAVCDVVGAGSHSSSQLQIQAPAQAPAPAPADDSNSDRKTSPRRARLYPRLEFFAGGSYAEAGLFNAGHWAGLPRLGRFSGV